MRVIRTLSTIASALTMGLGALLGFPVVVGAVLTVEAPVTMWEKVLEQRLASASPCAQMLFRAYKSWCMQHLKGISLQLIDLANVTVDTNPLDGAIRVYAIYVKKQATGTDTFFKVFDDATDDATAGDAVVAIPLMESGEAAMMFWPDGHPLADGLVTGAYTAYIGANNATPTTTGDGPNAFLLVG